MHGRLSAAADRICDDKDTRERPRPLCTLLSARDAHYACKGTYFGSPLSQVRIEFKTLEKLVENGLAEMVLGRRSTRRYYQRKVVAI